jgi:DNA (cytosine-5)-methyltransferase 1
MPPFVWKENALKQVGELKITAKKRSHDTPKEINEYLKANKNGKTIREIAESLDLPKTQVEHYFRSDKSRAIPSPSHWLLLKKLLGFDDTFDKEVTNIYEKEVEFESSRRVYSAKGISKTLDTHESGYYQVRQTSIRRLTPVECMRLQGFPDNHNEFGLLDGKKVAISDTQRYKQAGNAVTVNVVQEVGKKIYDLLHD